MRIIDGTRGWTNPTGTKYWGNRVTRAPKSRRLFPRRHCSLKRLTQQDKFTKKYKWVARIMITIEPCNCRN